MPVARRFPQTDGLSGVSAPLFCSRRAISQRVRDASLLLGEVSTRNQLGLKGIGAERQPSLGDGHGLSRCEASAHACEAHGRNHQEQGLQAQAIFSVGPSPSFPWSLSEVGQARLIRQVLQKEQERVRQQVDSEDNKLRELRMTRAYTGSMKRTVARNHDEKHALIGTLCGRGVTRRFNQRNITFLGLAAFAL